MCPGAPAPGNTKEAKLDPGTVRDNRTGVELLTFKESFIFYDAQPYINTSGISGN